MATILKFAFGAAVACSLPAAPTAVVDPTRDYENSRVDSSVRFESIEYYDIYLLVHFFDIVTDMRSFKVTEDVYKKFKCSSRGKHHETLINSSSLALKAGLVVVIPDGKLPFRVS